MHYNNDWQRALPEAQGSVTVRERVVELYRSDAFRLAAGMSEIQIVALVRWDDRCGNGSNSFFYHEAVHYARTTAESHAYGPNHPLLKKHFAAIPENIRALKKWNGFHPFGPWSYMANTLYHAGDRDCHGLRKGERRQIVNGKTGIPAWKLMAVSEHDGEAVEISELAAYMDSATEPYCGYALAYRPWYRVGEGKARELDYARSSAAWPDATDEQLMAETLPEALKMRLPALLREFRAELERLGIDW